MKKEGGLIFISHSHQDIETVRLIRNRFEALGFEPLMFYLKCLSDEDEIEGLIKREIDEREWFVYVDSQNARNSKWVQTEREYIESLPGKKVLVIDTERDVLRQTDSIARDLTVYVIYSAADMDAAERFMDTLARRDYQVLSLEPQEWGEHWKRYAKKKITAAAREGFVLYLVSERSIKSVNLQYQLEWARKRGGMVIPVLIGDADPGALPGTVRKSKYFRISAQPTEQELLSVLREMETHILHRVTG